VKGVLGWEIRDQEIGVGEGSELSWETFSTTAYANYNFDKGKYRLNKREGGDLTDKKMLSEKEQNEVPGRSTISSDSGRGATLEPSMADFIKFYVADQRKKDEPC